MKAGFIVRPGAAEFPHENALINRGALWIGTAMCGAENVASRRSSRREAPSSGNTGPRNSAVAGEPPRSTLIIPPPIERPNKSPATAVPDDPEPRAAPMTAVAAPAPSAPTTPPPNTMPAVTASPTEPAPVAASPADPAPDLTATVPPSDAATLTDAPHDERIETFVRAITDVARAHGAAETAAHAESLFKFGTPAPLALSSDARAALFDGNILEATDGGVHATAWFASTSSAWQRMLRGEEGNLAVCGESTLDGWTADLIARLVAKPGMASTIRRDLRRRGIAAFGMLDA